MTHLKLPFPLTRSKTAAATVIALAILAAVLAGVVSPSDPLEQDTARRLQPPGASFFLGSDNFGRDVLSRVLHGTRTALAVAVGGVATGALVGAAVGLVSAYRGGWLDLALQRIVDAFLGFPLLVLAVVVVVSLGVSVLALAAAIAVALAPQAARLARASALSVRAAGYVAAARTIGCSPARVLLRHVLPHSLGPVLVYATGFVATALAAEAALSYLGLGAPPANPLLGQHAPGRPRIPRNRPLANPRPRHRPGHNSHSLRPPRRRPLRPPHPPPHPLTPPHPVVLAQAGTSPTASRTPANPTPLARHSCEGRNPEVWRRGGVPTSRIGRERGPPPSFRPNPTRALPPEGTNPTAISL